MLPAEWLLRMRRPAAELKASSFGEAIGIAWFLRDIGGVATAGAVLTLAAAIKPEIRQAADVDML